MGHIGFGEFEVEAASQLRPHLGDWCTRFAARGNASNLEARVGERDPQQLAACISSPADYAN